MKKWAIVLVGLIISVLLVGCGDKADEDTKEVYSAKAEQVVNWINEKNYDKITEQLDENLKTQLTAEQLAQIEPVIVASGDFEKVEKSTVEEKEFEKYCKLYEERFGKIAYIAEPNGTMQKTIEAIKICLEKNEDILDKLLYPDFDEKFLY